MKNAGLIISEGSGPAVRYYKSAQIPWADFDPIWADFCLIPALWSVIILLWLNLICGADLLSVDNQIITFPEAGIIEKLDIDYELPKLEINIVKIDNNLTQAASLFVNEEIFDENKSK